MKYLILCFFIFINACNSQSQQVGENINSSSVTWESDLNSAFKKAKENGKIIFVEAYSPNCPYCMSLEPLFKDSTVAVNYNKDFVNVKLNIQDQNQVKFLNEKGLYLPSFPKFFFFDSDTNLVHQSSVHNTKKGLLEAHDQAIDPKTQSKNYASRYKNGERSVEFLNLYANHTMVTKDTTMNFEIADELYKAYPKDKIGSKESWEITKYGIRDANNGFAKYWFAHTPEAKKIEKDGGHSEASVDGVLGSIIQTTLYSSKGKNMSSEDVKKIERYMEQSGAGQYSQKILWNFYSDAYIKEGRPDDALKIGEDIAKVFNTGPALIYLSKFYIDKIPNNKRAQNDASNWLATALSQLKSDRDFAEYYYALAKLDLDKGEKESAKKDIQTAIENAVKANIDLKKFTDLKSSI